MDARKSPSSPRKDSPPNNTTHKTLKQRVDRLDSTVTALPLAFTEYLEAFGSFCLAGIKLASLLETFFQDTPVLTIALRFREACELLGDKCSKSSLFLKQELVPPVKRFGPTLGVLRNRVETHAKVLSKHESYLKQLECLKSSQNPSRSKVEQVRIYLRNQSYFCFNDTILLLEMVGPAVCVLMHCHPTTSTTVCYHDTCEAPVLIIVTYKHLCLYKTTCTII